MSTNNPKNNPETPKIEKIGPHNSIEKNLEILKKRLEEVKPGFDYEVSKNKKTLNLKYNGIKLYINVNNKNQEGLVDLAKLVKKDIENPEIREQILKKKLEINDFPGNTQYIVKNTFGKDNIIIDGEKIFKLINNHPNGNNFEISENNRNKSRYAKNYLKFLNDIIK